MVYTKNMELALVNFFKVIKFVECTHFGNSGKIFAIFLSK